MSFKSSTLWEHLKTTYERLKKKDLSKGFRIGYKVTWNLFLIFISILFISIFFIGGIAAGYFASLVKDQPILSYTTLKKDITNYSEASSIYFANDVPLGRLPSDLVRTNVSLKNVSPLYIHALLATEDQLFYKHHGVVPKSTFRALRQELTNQPVVTGGSTITQQLVKNQILNNQVSFDRKAKEILLSLRLEKFFNKDQILQAYINIIPFGRNSTGQNIAGIETAAKGIFNVDAKNLNLAQAAFIAGLPKNPFAYTPFENNGEVKTNISLGVNRAHVVLKHMLNVGYISNKQYHNALKYNYKSHFAPKSEPANLKYPALMVDIHERAEKQLAIIAANEQGYDGENLEKDATQLKNLEWLTTTQKNQGINHTIQENAQKSGFDYKKMKQNADLFNQFINNASKSLDRDGYKIHTTINKAIYDKMQEAATNSNAYEPDKIFTTVDSKTGKNETIHFPMEVGSVLIKNDTGAIISYVPGRANKVYQYSKVNHATQTTRQNGSTMKPLLDYGPAIENGLLSPGTIMADLPTKFPGEYEPHNYGEAGNGLFHGLETVRQALILSHNIPALETYYDNRQHFEPLNYLKKMGFSSLLYPDKGPLPVGIGGLTKGVTVEENTNAYATFANGGNFVDAYMIDKITTHDGKVIYQHKVQPVKVFSAQTSYLMIDMLRGVMKGNGTAADVSGRLKFNSDWYGKTGTSQDWHDGWFVASNPNVTLGIWTGFDQQQANVNGTVHSLELNHSNYHLDQSILWSTFANAAYDVNPKLMNPDKHFHMPTGIVKRSFCGLTNGAVTSSCKNAGLTVTDLFNAKYLPNDKVDLSMNKGAFVTIAGKTYRALPSTPKEFTEEGNVLDTNLLKSRFPYLITNNIKMNLNNKNNLNSTQSFPPNNEIPVTVNDVRLTGKRLTWSPSPSHDVIGYYIYGASNGDHYYHKLAAIRSDNSLSYIIPAHIDYSYIAAVDITGKVSDASSIIRIKNTNTVQMTPEDEQRKSLSQQKIDAKTDHETRSKE